MQKPNQLSKYVAAVLFSCTATLLGAQETAQSDEDVEELGKVSVTGTRIKQIDSEGVSQVITISEQDITESTANNLPQLLKELSLTRGGEGSFSTHNSGALQADSPVGQAAVSLRGLGSASTLVLINGRRMAPSSFAFGSQNFVDINAIPLTAVERVEILPSGASAIYGADAVAGVVNLILKQGVVAHEAKISYADSEAGTDESRSQFSITWGNSTDSTDLNVFFDYYDKNALYDRDRRQTAISFDPSQQGIFPSFNTQYFDDDDYVENSCPDGLRYDGRNGFPTSAFGEYCEYNQNAFLPTYPEFNSISGGFFSNTSIGGGKNWFNEIFYSSTESTTNSTSAPFSGVAVPFNHPNMPVSLQQRFIDLWDDLGAPPEDSLLMWGRFLRPRTIQNESDSYRLVTGLNGYVNDWEWNTSITHAVSQSDQIGVAGIVNVAQFEAALFGELCGDGSINCSPGNGGLFFNPFDGQANNSDDIWDLIQKRVPRRGESTMTSLDFNITGSLFEMPHGTVESAFGAEVRTEEIIDRPSPLATADPLNNNEVPVYGFGSTGTNADRNSYAIYGEVQMPITEELEVQLAARYDHYDDFGGDFNPKIGFSYRPNDAFLLRGSWNTSFRAPSLAQVGAQTTLSSGALECTAEFLENFCGGFGGTDGFLSEIYANPDLQAEESVAFNLGFAISFNDDATLTVDYWDFEHENIVGVDEELLFRRALAGEIQVVAEGDLGPDEIGIETRDGTIGSPIEEIHLQLENLGVQKTSGIDVTYTHYFDSDWGQFTWLFDGTYLLNYDRQLSKQSAIEDLEGTFRYPELVLRNKLRWRTGDWSTALTGIYTSSYEDNLEQYTESDLANFGILANRKVPSWLKWNLSVSYDLSQYSYLTFGINNLFDKAAPLAYGTSANVDHFNHDTYGRYYRLSYVHRF
jgi:iron complex outermembrane receptor protein